MLRRFLKPKANIEQEIFSPNRKNVFKFFLKQGRIFYEVYRENEKIVRESKLGIDICEGEKYGEKLKLVMLRNHSFDETWETIWGEDRKIRNNYNECVFYFTENTKEKRLLTLKVRVFNDGAAFCYEIPPQPSFSSVTIRDELTEFNVDPVASAWQIPAYQPDRYEYNYEKKQIFELDKPVHTPLTIESMDGIFLAIHEAKLFNYGAMNLETTKRKVLKADVTPLSDGNKAHVELPFATPWRVIMIADTATDLIKNRMILNLNDPPKQDFSWVKPIKFLGIWWAMFVGEWTWAPGERHGATTKHAIEYLKSCRKLGIDGLLVEGWNNGWEGDWLKNGAYTNFTQPTSDFDLNELANFAKENKLELVGHHETVGFVDNYEKQIESAYKFYADRGVKYIKTGYAGSMMTIGGKKEWHHSQLGVRHYQRTVELAAKYQICLDIHEPIKGTGIERTWPNLLTREGARGQEYEGGALSPSHTTILPFTRLLAGGMDYTSGIFDILNNTKRIATTLARQLAYFVVIPSGMEMAADRPKFYEEIYPDVFKFIRDVPVNWEKTIPIGGEIGSFYAVARKKRKADEWFIGGVTNEHAKKLRFKLDFLDDNCKYLAEAYFDAEDAHFRDNPLAIKIETWKVKKTTILEMFMAAGGGFAIRFKKVEE